MNESDESAHMSTAEGNPPNISTRSRELNSKEIIKRSGKSDLDQVLVGLTMKVYRLLLTSEKPLTAREVQKKLKLSSPSVAVFHLDKLERVNLISKGGDGSGTYAISALYLKHYFRLRRFLIPRFVFHSVLTTFLLLGWFILLAAIYSMPSSAISITKSSVLGIEVLSIYGILAMLTVVIMFWFETVRVFKQDKI